MRRPHQRSKAPQVARMGCRGRRLPPGLRSGAQGEGRRKKKGCPEDMPAKVGANDLDTSTTLESNKSLGPRTYRQRPQVSSNMLHASWPTVWRCVVTGAGVPRPTACGSGRRRLPRHRGGGGHHRGASVSCGPRRRVAGGIRSAMDQGREVRTCAQSLWYQFSRRTAAGIGASGRR